MPSRFGVFDHIENIPGTPTSQLFKDRLDPIRMADQAGFAGHQFAEHHGSDLCTAPGQELLIAAAWQVTSDIGLGAMVKLLPMPEDECDEAQAAEVMPVLEPSATAPN